MNRAERIAEIERQIRENTEWRAAWTAANGSVDATEFHRRGDEIKRDKQELDLLKASGPE